MKNFQSKLTGKRKFFRFMTTVFIVAWMVTIFLFSAQPAEASSDMSGRVSYSIAENYAKWTNCGWDKETINQVAQQIDFPIRKLAHMTEYGILSWITYAFLTAWGIKAGKSGYLFALSITFLYACTDEIHQIFVPGRSGQLVDVIIDTSGALIALGILWCVKFLINNRKR